MPERLTRIEEQVKKFLEDMPVLKTVCVFPPIPDELSDREFNDLLSKRLKRLKEAFDIVEKFKRSL